MSFQEDVNHKNYITLDKPSQAMDETANVHPNDKNHNNSSPLEPKPTISETKVNNRENRAESIVATSYVEGYTTNESEHTRYKVCFGEEIIDLHEKEDPISLETFQVLMEEDHDKPFFTFSFVHSKDNKNTSYRHLYSAENFVEWYPLQGETDIVSREEIEKVEYYFYMKGHPEAIHMGDVVPQEGHHDDGDIGSLRKDILIWSLTAEDEPSRMMCLLAVAYLYNLGYTSSSDTGYFDRHSTRSQEQQQSDYSHANMIYNYIVNRLMNLIQMEKLRCSDPHALIISIQHDAAEIVAKGLVELDPDVNDDSDDYSKIPHIRTNALMAAILAKCVFDDPASLTIHHDHSDYTTKHL